MDFDASVEAFARAVGAARERDQDLAPQIAPLVAIADTLRPSRPIDQSRRDATKALMLATFATAQASDLATASATQAPL